MKLKKIISVSLFLLPITDNKIISANCENKYALVIKPVIDMIGDPISDISSYNKMPLSPVNKKDKLTCPRIHQLLFNQIVKILKEEDKEVLVQVFHAFHETADNKQFNAYRTLKKNLIPFDELIKQNLNLAKIPKSIDFAKNNQNNFTNIVTLKSPFKDKTNNIKYSAGTRFVCLDKNNKLKYSVYIFNPKKMNFDICEIPKELFISNNNEDKQKRISKFVKLVKEWSNQKNGFIPYVWGGCSYCNLCDNPEFEQKTVVNNNNQISYFDLPKYKHAIKTGFDCSGLILRAAQICDLPFFFKNSTTMANNIDYLKSDDKLSNGDLIWIPGHIMIISDLKHNLVVEATDYSNGYGKVHEINIGKIFKGIKTFHALKQALIKNKPIERLNKDGNVFQVIKNFKILKLNSI